jgi:hypothetical protein
LDIAGDPRIYERPHQCLVAGTLGVDAQPAPSQPTVPYTEVENFSTFAPGAGYALVNVVPPGSGAKLALE